MKNVIISNPRELEETIKKISQDGKDKFHVITDFDRTLTKAFVNGEKIPSLISVLRNGEYLTEDYSQKAHNLFNKYHPIEIALNISSEEKRKAMEEWWTSHFKLLIESGLNKKDIEKVVKSEKIKLREGCLEFLNILRDYNIPLVILSSAGLGKESISLYLKENEVFYKSIHIISNSFKWDKNGNVISVNKPIINSMNKDETLIHNYSFYDKIKNRKNVLLLGDTLEDIGMIKGFPYKNLVKVGFLNEKENIESLKEAYQKVYDVVILNDGKMDYVNGLLKRLTKN